MEANIIVHGDRVLLWPVEIVTDPSKRAAASVTGTVVAIGDGCHHIAVGDRVFVCAATANATAIREGGRDMWLVPRAQVVVHLPSLPEAAC